MERTSYSKLSQRDVDRAETDLLINLSAITQRGLAKMIGCHESEDKQNGLEIYCFGLVCFRNGIRHQSD